jgi:hypothetical protein
VPLPSWGVPQQALVRNSGLGREVGAPRSARADPVLTAGVAPDFTPYSGGNGGRRLAQSAGWPWNPRGARASAGHAAPRLIEEGEGTSSAEGRGGRGALSQWDRRCADDGDAS